MPSDEVAKRQTQEVSAAKSQQLRRVEEYEAEASASAQAGLNLNIFAAFSGIFSGRKKKVTDTAKDGTSHSVEHSEGHSRVKGHGTGTLNAIGAGEVKTKERVRVVDEARAIESKVDHLGIEGPK